MTFLKNNFEFKIVQCVVLFSANSHSKNPLKKKKKKMLSIISLALKTDSALNQITNLLVENEVSQKVINLVLSSASKLLFSTSSTSTTNAKHGNLLKSFVKFTVVVPSIMTVVGYFLCRFRLMPHRRLYQAWWAATAVAGFVSVGAALTPVALLYKIGLVSERTLFVVSSHAAQSLCKWLHWMNPQLRVFNQNNMVITTDKSPTSQQPITFHDVKKGSIYIVNHTSMWDGFVMFDQPHFGFFKHVKFMGKAGIADIPVVGFLIFTCLQYFKVYFAASDNKTDADYNNWALDKDKQQKEMDRVVQWIKDGNTFAFSCEGRINRTPMTIQNPRHGMLKVFFNEDLVKNAFPEKDKTKRDAMLPDIFLLTICGVQDFWPMAEPAGGFPCDVDVSLSKFEYPGDLEQAWTKIGVGSSGTVQEEVRVLDAGLVADDVQRFMQKELDKVASVRSVRMRRN